MGKYTEVSKVSDDVAQLIADKADYALTLLEARYALEVSRKLVRQKPEAVRLIDDVLKQIKQCFERPASNKEPTQPFCDFQDRP